MLPVNRAAHRVARQTMCEGRMFDPFIDTKRWIESGFARAVLDEFHCPEQAAATNITNMAMIAKPFHQATFQKRAGGADIGEEVFLRDHFLHRKRRRTGHRMRLIGMAMLESASAALQGFHNAPMHQNTANRLIASAKPLRNHLNIR